MSTPPAEHAIDVGDTELGALRWGPDPAASDAVAVLGVHGITANAASFSAIGARLGGHRPVAAVDLRGRGRSSAAPARYGIAQHARDVIAALDRLGVERAVLAGHSMGGFVCAMAAADHPERVAGLLLLDGGYALPAAEDTDIRAVLGPSLARLSRTFPSVDAYREFWQRHPAFVGGYNDHVEAYIRRDLTGDPPRLRSSCHEEAVRVDGEQILRDAAVLGAIHRLTVPTRLLWAQRGLLDETPGLYTAQRLEGLAGGAVTTRHLPDTNHYTLMFSSTADVIAGEVDALAEQAVNA